MNRKAAELLKEKDLFVHIGDAELRAAFPAENPTIAALYDEITKKQKHLAKLQILSEKIAEREKQANIPVLMAETERLKAQLQSLGRENEEQKNDLKMKELDLERAKKELESKKKRNNEHMEQLKALNTTVQRREKERSERADQKDDYFARLAIMEDLAREKEAEAEDLANCFAADNRTGQELETYFKKLTKRVFDKQSEFDKMRIGKLPGKHVGVNKTSLVDHAAVRPPQQSIEANRKKNQEISAKLERQIEETGQQASVLEEKWFELQDQLSDAQNAFAFEQMKIKEQNNKKRRIHVAETLGRLEPKPTMYKRYLSAQSIDKRSTAGKSDQFTKRKDLQMRENEQLMKSLDKEIEALKVQIEQVRKAPPGTPSSGASSTRSRLSLPRIPLNDAEKKTQQIVDEHTKEALKELKKEKQQVEDNIAVVSTEVQNIEKEIHKLHVELKKEETNKENAEEKTKKLKEELKDIDDHVSLKSDHVKEENVSKINQKMDEIEKLLTRRAKIDKERADLMQEIEQAKVDENNLKNRFKAMSSLKNNYKEDVQEYHDLKQKHSAWVGRVNEAKESLEAIMRLRSAANSQNQIAKQSLAAVQPYFDEYTEYETLKREERRLNEKLKRSRSEGNLSATE